MFTKLILFCLCIVSVLGTRFYPENCYLPAKTGPCRAGFRRFFFNKNTEKCEIFIYGGCLGNANNYRTEELCNVGCTNKRQETPLSH